MPRPFRRLSIEQFARELEEYPFGARRISAVHMHHTFHPDHSEWRGERSIEAMWRFHTAVRKWSDIAQHVTIDPQGSIWTGRPWISVPASAAGHNGTAAAHPFMFEMIGNFDIGHDRLAGPQLHAAIEVVALVQERFQLPPESLRFHNQMSSKTCPGSSLSYEEILAQVRGRRASLPDRPERAAASVPHTPSARSALCVGINTYPDAPLEDAVADALLWSRALQRLGFQTTIVTNCDATRANLVRALEQLITGARPGDVLVFQYAGHGTTVRDLDGDELDGYDEVICPYDYATGALLIDDDIARIFRALPDGVNLTCFIDCCHSGTITRFAAGPPTASNGFRRARFIRATAGLERAHAEFRRTLGALSREAPAPMREVLFAACRPEEVAYENGGHGEFSRRGVALLEAGIAGVTNAEFQRRVTVAFGPRPLQHPSLDCAPAARSRRLLEPHAG
ncbi:MAG: caspase family protein [Acidobacteria bacterium]|nr:caspase family protein [Acidobacteriota bacterium]